MPRGPWSGTKGHGLRRPANWSTGHVPGPDNIAVFPDVAAQVKMTGGNRHGEDTGGIVLGTGPATNVLIPDFYWKVAVGWTINGTGTIAVGKQGIVMPECNGVIHPSLELSEDQTWSIGTPTAQKVLTSAGRPWLWNERDFINWAS